MILCECAVLFSGVRLYCIYALVTLLVFHTTLLICTYLLGSVNLACDACHTPQFTSGQNVRVHENKSLIFCTSLDYVLFKLHERWNQLEKIRLWDICHLFMEYVIRTINMMHLQVVSEMHQAACNIFFCREWIIKDHFLGLLQHNFTKKNSGQMTAWCRLQ